MRLLGAHRGEQKGAFQIDVSKEESLNFESIFIASTKGKSYRPLNQRQSKEPHYSLRIDI